MQWGGFEWVQMVPEPVWLLELLLPLLLVPLHQQLLLLGLLVVLLGHFLRQGHSHRAADWG